MLAEFGLGRLPARPPLDYLVTTGAEALVWSLDLIMLRGLVVLALTVVGRFSGTRRSRRWAQLFVLVTVLVAIAALVRLAHTDGTSVPLVLGTIGTAWLGWIVYLRVRATERLFRSPLLISVPLVHGGFAVVTLGALGAVGFLAAAAAGETDAAVVRSEGTWVTVHSTQPLAIDKAVHGAYWEYDTGNSGYRHRYEGFRLIWSNGSRVYLLSVAGDPAARPVIGLDEGGANRLEYRNGHLSKPGCLGR